MCGSLELHTNFVGMNFIASTQRKVVESETGKLDFLVSAHFKFLGAGVW